MEQREYFTIAVIRQIQGYPPLGWNPTTPTSERSHSQWGQGFLLLPKLHAVPEVFLFLDLQPNLPVGVPLLNSA